MEGEALGMGTDKYDVTGLKVFHSSDLLEAHLLTPLGHIGYHIALDGGLIRESRTVQDPVHQTVAARVVRAVVDGRIVIRAKNVYKR